MDDQRDDYRELDEEPEWPGMKALEFHLTWVVILVVIAMRAAIIVFKL
jgi:hypothetical protein